MKAVTWQGRRNVSVEDVEDPIIKEPNDAIIKVTSTNICGSDLHLYETMGAFMSPGDVLGHEAIGIVLEVGHDITQIRPGDRVVVPFQISCGHCWMCERSLYTQCETTQVRGEGSGAALFGYSKLYGRVPGGQAEYLRVPEAQFTHILVPEGPPDDHFIYLSDVLPTAWQAVEYAGVPDGGSLLILGLGPIGDMASRIAQEKWIDTIIAVDLVDERLARAIARGIQVIDLNTGNVQQWLRLEGQVRELFDVAVIPGVRCPMGVSPQSREFATTISRVDEFGSLDGAAEATPRATAA